MKSSIARILRKYGQTVKVNGTETRAFIQPAREKTVPFEVSSLGAVDDRKWMYLGETKLKLGDRVEFRGRGYTVRSCESVYIGDEIVYWWASLTAEREAAE